MCPLADVLQVIPDYAANDNGMFQPEPSSRHRRQAAAVSAGDRHVPGCRLTPRFTISSSPVGTQSYAAPRQHVRERPRG